MEYRDVTNIEWLIETRRGESSRGIARTNNNVPPFFARSQDSSSSFPFSDLNGTCAASNGKYNGARKIPERENVG